MKNIVRFLSIIIIFLAFQNRIWALSEMTVGSVTEMTNLTGLTDGDLANVSSGTEIDGQFRFFSGSSATVDNALIFSANNGRWIRIYSEGVNVKWFGAAGDGNNDDTNALQDCIDYASLNYCKVFLPTGRYKITSPLDIKSNVSISGQGRTFGTVIVPTNCYAFKIDGSDKSSGWVFRIRISDMLIDCNDTSDEYADSIIEMTYAFNVELVRVWVFDQTTANGVEISYCNAITLEDYIGYGKSTILAAKGVYVHDYATVRLVRPDIENYAHGTHSSGTDAITNIENPYSERCVINVHHESGTGATTVNGGMLASVNGYCVSVWGNNFILRDTVMKSYNGQNLTGMMAYTANGMYNNVKIEPANDYSGAINDTYLNYATVDMVKNISGMKSSKIEFKVTAADNVLTDLFTFENCNTIKVVDNIPHHISKE